MENKVESEFRVDETEAGKRAVARAEFVRNAGEQFDDSVNRGEDYPKTVAGNLNAEVVVETDEEYNARQRSEWLERVSDTEIVENGVSTTAYRRAIADFDAGDSQLQLAEFYELRDPDFESEGRF